MDNAMRRGGPVLDEAARLQALRDLDILDTPPEDSFQRLTALATQFFGLPYALISLVDAERQWFKASCGINMTETRREDSFCTRTIQDNQVFLVPDTWRDPEYRHNKLVTGTPYIRFYAGAPLRTAAGHRIGTLCLIDTVPHDDFGPRQKALLIALADVAMDQIALRQTRKTLAAAARTAHDGWEQAEQSSLVKADFLATMAHEIRTPLNGIVGMADVLMETPLDEEQKQCVQTLQSAAHHLHVLINNVLDFSKLEACSAEVQPEEVDAGAMIQEVLDLLTPSAQAKQIRLAAMLDSRLPRVLYFDASKLKQILINIVGNAVKFTHTGAVTAELSCTPGIEQGTALLRCEVRDTGIGIAPDDLTRLFTRYTQPNAEVARTYGGSGLGLAISKHLATLLGGDIKVRSVVGRGSVFTVEIPVSTTMTAITPQPPAPASSTATGSASTCSALEAGAPPSAAPAQRLRILLVEDNEINQTVATAIFHRMGHELTVAGDGVSAISAVSTGLYDLVFMDMMMPGLDGPAAVRGIRKLRGSAARIYIIALTANASHAHREICLAAGMDDFIAKPATRVQLEAAIARYANAEHNAEANAI
ncbi:MAG: hypothetical protein B7X08_01120 [Acidocella sp. 20-63-7]|nr:MAG: hypothetical protein B7X08_01120 [Acidocella sp. 20-63-7]HQT45844.1 ATP-binding protein [Acidocella sp.]